MHLLIKQITPSFGAYRYEVYEAHQELGGKNWEELVGVFEDHIISRELAFECAFRLSRKHGYIGMVFSEE